MYLKFLFAANSGKSERAINEKLILSGGINTLLEKNQECVA